VRALVLGGSVFVGKRLVTALLAGGHDVAVLNRGRTPTDLPDEVQRIVADRTDVESMRAALASTEWDVVYDVSGFVMVAGGSDIPALLELLDGRVGSYVFVSSIMAYDQEGLAGLLPWTENLSANAEGTRSYGGFKALSEQAMLERHDHTGFPASVVRPAAIYGPDNNIFDMETPLFLRVQQHRPILVPHSGLVSGSYGHVDDLCAVLVTMAAHPAAPGQVFNVSGEGVTVERYVHTLAEIVGTEPDIVYVPDAVLDHLTTPVFGHLFGRRHHAVLDCSKARRLLGALPSYDLRSGHEHTFEWFKAQGWEGRTEPLVDPVWRATWDFDAEAKLAATLR
jgi:nucleoside-diphosphate-sugar epimerase